MIVLGLGFEFHEASVALVVDGELKVAIARERLTRVKRDGTRFGTKKYDLSVAIQYCLEATQLNLGDVDLLVWNSIGPSSPIEVTVLLMLEGGMDFSGIPLLVLPHHFAHACCSLYLSPFSEAAVLVVDGRGNRLKGIRSYCAGPDAESVNRGATIIQRHEGNRAKSACEFESFYHFNNGRWNALRKIVGTSESGIGGTYGGVSQALFGDPLDAGKTMGLAPYGTSETSSVFLKSIGPPEMPMFQGATSPEWSQFESQTEKWRRANERLNYLDSFSTTSAAAIQLESEEALLTHARWLKRATGSTNLCLSGGVALNCVANSRLAREAGFDAVFVPPAPGDDGIAVGCALYGAAINGEVRRDSCPVFVGRSYSHEGDRLAALGLRAVPVDGKLADWVAQCIADGSVVAWYQGGAEIGPRALGHRSFLADPRNPGMRDHLNSVVKNREAFRPFAPVVLEEAVLDFFEQHHPSYFMSFVATVRRSKRSTVPAITHVDGTARYQVLRKADNPELDEIVRAFAKITGVPMLLNTSLNRAGEPIVETPEDAALCMLASSADYLILDGFPYQRSDD